MQEMLCKVNRWFLCKKDGLGARDGVEIRSSLDFSPLTMNSEEKLKVRLLPNGRPGRLSYESG